MEEVCIDLGIVCQEAEVLDISDEILEGVDQS
jgi:hypothetical protein